MCRGGGGNLLYLLCLISNTLPQLEQSSLHPQQFSVFASCYRPPATTISVFSYTSTAPVKKNRSSNRLGTTPPPQPGGGGEARRAFGPSAHYRNQMPIQTKIMVKLLKGEHTTKVVTELNEHYMKVLKNCVLLKNGRFIIQKNAFSY